LLTTLNLIHAVIPNYGVAIILLTVIVKIIFWPLTHKGTESAKKMQKIQPLVAELREKYKDQPQKMQKAQMALYKEHGVNPMASCLPMLVQLPIFIALFTVLRSAVELRFAPFLWIADLSEPEGLLAGVLPFPQGGLNILPILMTLTMVLQQRLTPTAGDPQQQKMMMIMPVVMLFILYSMPSALVLYWTVSQSLSIAQLVWQRKSKGDDQ
jgi:YidC/Oxa1 family membrane protein insertase